MVRLGHIGVCLLLLSWVISAQRDGRFVEVRNLGPEFNSPGRDIGVGISGDGLTLLLYSERPGGRGGSDIWIAERRSATEDFAGFRNLALNTPHFEGGPKLSRDGLTLYFASDRPGGVGDVDLWAAARPSPDADFSDVTNLGSGANSRWRDAGPVLSADELTVYFQSERPGGHGGRDIYAATRESRREPFADVENLGPGINSAWNEFRGSISSDGLTYFFSSNRPIGLGASDVYVATRTTLDGVFDNPRLLAPPVNSATTDVGPTISADWPSPGSKLYFASRTGDQQSDRSLREGEGGLDIFEATWSGP